MCGNLLEWDSRPNREGTMRQIRNLETRVPKPKDLTENVSKLLKPAWFSRSARSDGGNSHTKTGSLIFGDAVQDLLTSAGTLVSQSSLQSVGRRLGSQVTGRTIEIRKFMSRKLPSSFVFWGRRHTPGQKKIHTGIAQADTSLYSGSSTHPSAQQVARA